MKKPNVITTPLLASILFTAALSNAHAASYEVTLTNATRGLNFTPRLVITHETGNIFTVGQAALPELVQLAEGGATQPLQDLLTPFSVISDTQSGDGLLAPGESQTLTISGSDLTNKLTLLSMVLPSNDGFIALNGVDLPTSGSVTYNATVYDAGSESNDELCANIPGPTCGGSADSPDDSGEGYVHVHSGIHGGGDLSVATHDWRNPGAKVTITKMDQ